jgi:hypothetical protein
MVRTSDAVSLEGDDEAKDRGGDPDDGLLSDEAFLVPPKLRASSRRLMMKGERDWKANAADRRLMLPSRTE